MSTAKDALNLIESGEQLMRRIAAGKFEDEEKADIWKQIKKQLKELGITERQLEEEIRYIVDGGPDSTETNKAEIDVLRTVKRKINAEYERFFTFIQEEARRFTE